MSSTQPLAHKDGQGGFRLGPNGEKLPLAVVADGAPPKYLIRDDGYVLPWNPILAKNARFQPSNHLPQAHLSAIGANQDRREEAREALKERREQVNLASEDKKDRQIRELTERLLATQSLVQTPAPDPRLEAQLRTDELRLAKLNKAGLIAYAAAEFKVAIPSNLVDDAVKGEVRKLQQARREATALAAAAAPATSAATT